MPTTHTRLIKFNPPVPMTPEQFRAVEQKLIAQIEAGGDRVLDHVWTVGEFDAVFTIEAAGEKPAVALVRQAQPDVERSVDLAHRPL